MHKWHSISREQSAPLYAGLDMEMHRHFILILYFVTFVCDTDVLAEVGHTRCDGVWPLFNDCCLNSTDTELTNGSIPRGITCRNIGFTRCNLVDSCDSHWKDEQTREKCEDVEDDVTSTLVHLLPVVGYSSEIALMYRNQFCALCNFKREYDMILPGLLSRSCNVFRLLDLLPVTEDNIASILSYLTAELQCILALDASYRFQHCRRCDCISPLAWLPYVTEGFVAVNYLQDDAYECFVNESLIETDITDGVCGIGERYVNDSCVWVFSTIAPSQGWRFIHAITDRDMDSELYGFNTAAEFLEAAKRAVSTQLGLGSDWLLYWHVREIRGLHNMTSHTCFVIQLDIVIENIIVDPHQDEVFLSKHMYEFCEECRALGTFVPEYMFLVCRYSHAYELLEMGQIEKQITVNASITQTPETISNGTIEPEDIGMENGASPFVDTSSLCVDTSSLCVILVWLSLVTILPLTYHC